MTERIRKIIKHHSFRSGIRYCISCGLSLAIKLVLFEIFSVFLSEEASYACVQIPLFFSSYYLHSINSFKAPISFKRIFSYLKLSIVFQILDFLVFVVIFNHFKIHDQISVLMATSVIFIARYFWIKRALATNALKN